VNETIEQEHKERQRQNVMWFKDGSAIVPLDDGAFHVRERTETSRQREFERLCVMDRRNYFLKSRNRWAFWRRFLWNYA
jgi:hypothetical protein